MSRAKETVAREPRKAAPRCCEVPVDKQSPITTMSSHNITASPTMLQNSLKLKIFNAVIFLFTAFSIVSNRGVMSVFLVVLSLTFFFTSALCILPIHRRIGRSELSQYQKLRQHGVVLWGKITFSGNSSKQGDDFLAEGELRYRMKVNDTIQEICKEYVATRSYKPESGTVEAVEVTVLPGFPKSGGEPNHIKKEADRIITELMNRKRYLIVCLAFSLAMWPCLIREARKEDKMFLIWLYLAIVTTLIPAGLVILALRPKPSSLWFWICFVYAIYGMDFTTQVIVDVRLGQEVSWWHVAQIPAFAAFLLFAATKNRKTCRQDILDPVDDVTVADVCLNDIDYILDSGIKQPFLGDSIA